MHCNDNVVSGGGCADRGKVRLSGATSVGLNGRCGAGRGGDARRIRPGWRASLCALVQSATSSLHRSHHRSSRQAECTRWPTLASAGLCRP